MQGQLDEAGKRFLLFLFNNKTATIDLRVGNTLQTARNLIALGALDRERPAFTNRGICHLVVECKVPFSVVQQTFPKEYASAGGEINHMKNKGFAESEMDIYFYHKYAQYLDWDLFDQSGTYKYMDPEQLHKFSFAVFERMVRDERIDLAKVLRMYGLPKRIITERNLDRATMSRIFDYLRE